MKRVFLFASLFVVVFAGRILGADAKPVTIAVMPLENLGSIAEYDGLREGLADGLRTGLEGKKGIKIVERSQLQSIMAEQKLGMTGLIDAATAAGVGKLLGARHLLTGSFLVWNGRIKVLLKFVDVETGRIDLGKTIVAESKQDDALEMAEQLAGTIEKNLKKSIPAADSAVKPYRIAILPFLNNAKKAEYDGVGPYQAEALATALSQRGDIAVVERAQLQKLVSELKLGTTGAVDAASAARIGKLQGANYLMLGSYSVIGKKIQLSARFVETATGEVGALPSQQVVGELDKLFVLTDQLAGKIKVALTVDK